MNRILFFLMLLFFPLYAFSNDAQNAGHFDDSPSRARLPNISLPTGYVISKGTPIFSHIEIQDKSVYSSKTSSFHNLFLRMGVQFKSLDSGLQLNLIDALSQDSVIRNGLVQKPTPEFLEKLWVSWEAFSVGDSKDPWLAFSLQVGRQAATPFGVFVLPYRNNMSIVDANKLDQVDLIALNAMVSHNTVIEVVAFMGQERTAGAQTKTPSIALNMLHTLRNQNMNIYLSFANTREGFINPNHLFNPKNSALHRQRGEETIVASGIEYIKGSLTFSLESSYAHTLDPLFKDEFIFSAQVAYEVPNSSMTLFCSYEYFGSTFQNETGHLLSIGAQWKILENVYFMIEGTEIWPTDQEDISAISAGLLITPH